MKEILNTSEPKPILSDDKRLFPDMPQEQEEYLQELAKKSPSLAEAIRKTAKEKLSEPERPRFVAKSANEALKPQPPIDWIIDGLMSTKSVVEIHGDGGSKKTYCLYYMLVCASKGIPFLQFKTKKSKCLILDEESGETRLLRRLEEILKGGMIEDISSLEYMSLKQVKLDNTADVIDLMNFIQVNQYDIIVIDALSDVMDGDENSKKDTQPVFNNLRKIAEETGALIIIIHHSNKIGGYRGSSAIKGSVDLMLEVVSNEGSPIIKFTSKKERDIERISFSAKASWQDKKFYLQQLDFDDQVNALSDAEQHVIETLEQYGELFINEIEAKGTASDFTGASMRTAIKKLVKDGLIIRTNEGGRGKQAKYGITPKKDGN